MIKHLTGFNLKDIWRFCAQGAALWKMLEWNKVFFFVQIWALVFKFRLPFELCLNSLSGGDQQSSGAACSVKFDWFNCSSNTDADTHLFIHHTGGVCSLKVYFSTALNDPEPKWTWQMVVWAWGVNLNFGTDLFSVSAVGGTETPHVEFFFFSIKTVRTTCCFLIIWLRRQAGRPYFLFYKWPQCSSL